MKNKRFKTNRFRNQSMCLSVDLRQGRPKEASAGNLRVSRAYKIERRVDKELIHAKWNLV